MRYVTAVAALGLLLDVTGTAAAVTYAEWEQAVISGADFIIDYQNNDGGWTWNIDKPVADNYDATATSPGNTFGCTARGLIRAYQLTGDSDYLTAANNAAGGMQSLPFYYNKDVEFAHELAAIPGGTDVTAFTDADAVSYLSGKASPGVSAAQGLHDAYWSGAPARNGSNVWMLGEWVHVGRLLGSSEITTEYTGDDFAVEMASLVDGDYGTYFDPDPGARASTLGLVGMLEGAFWGGGTYTNTPASETELANRVASGALVGIPQDLGYATYSLGLMNNPIAMTGSAQLVGMLDEGAWYSPYGEYWNSEAHGEALLGLSENPIPEPVTMAGLMLGIGAIGGYVRRRRKA